MILDDVSLLIVTLGVVTVVSVLFMAEVWVRRTTAADRIWSISFVSVIATVLAYVAQAIGLDTAWVSALASATTVFALWAFWSGARAYSGQQSLLWVAGTIGVVVFLTVFAGRGDSWAAWVTQFGALVIGGTLLAVEILTGPIRRAHPGRVLAVLAALSTLYHCVRLALLLFYGAHSPEFTSYAGTNTTTIVLATVIVGAAFCMVSLRAGDIGRGERLALNFDPLTGARTPATFRRRAVKVLDVAEAADRQACLVVVRPESVEAISIAFGPEHADRALAHCGEVVTSLAPRTYLGLEATGKIGFEVLLPDTRLAEGIAWATGVRKELIAAPLEVPNSRLRLTVSLGVACVEQVGYDLDDLRQAARSAADRAVAEGGNRVVAAEGVWS